MAVTITSEAVTVLVRIINITMNVNATTAIAMIGAMFSVNQFFFIPLSYISPRFPMNSALRVSFLFYSNRFVSVLPRTIRYMDPGKIILINKLVKDQVRFTPSK